MGRTVIQQRLNARIDPIRGNDIATEMAACRRRHGVARCRVVDLVWRSAQIADPHRRSRDFCKEWSNLNQASAFETPEVKQFVFLDGSADGAAVLVINVLRIRLRTIR